MSYAPTGILNKNMVQDKIKFPLHCSARRKPPIPANNSRIRGIFCEINDTKVQIPNCFFTLLNYCKRSYVQQAEIKHYLRLADFR
ncbi:hypothetical protein T4D_2454 [Trichinella pseudospiralis]|uniref:Uncharacterized protein n=1 Tax=Trichinella pseudospiralis TaxID=6337 RepID=A0A0V1FXT0_TRIPS|nr:hypothetical protein T4D_2454 [Trichinella pseudospiralis]